MVKQVVTQRIQRAGNYVQEIYHDFYGAKSIKAIIETYVILTRVICSNGLVPAMKLVKCV